MAKYLLFFEKRGLIKYTSHLDLLRIFKRAFNKAAIQLVYSEGFNPHPRLTFCQPLSLGFEGAYEPLEFETPEEYNGEDLMVRLNENLPKGLKVLKVQSRIEEKHSIAKTLNKACYKIRLSGSLFKEDLPFLVKQFMTLEEITAERQNKKRKIVETINIKPLIVEITGFYENETPVLNCILRAGSNGNLSPELVITSFFKYAKVDFVRNEIQVERLFLEFE